MDRLNMKKVDFYEFEEARLTTGLFFARMLDELAISERTYYRWKAQGKAPAWALKIVVLLSGDLSVHGWQNWQIRRGVLTTCQLNSAYHYWTPSELLARELMGVNPSRPVPIGSKLRNVPEGGPQKSVDNVAVADARYLPASREDREAS